MLSTPTPAFSLAAHWSKPAHTHADRNNRDLSFLPPPPHTKRRTFSVHLASPLLSPRIQRLLQPTQHREPKHPEPIRPFSISGPYPISSPIALPPSKAIRSPPLPSATDYFTLPPLDLPSSSLLSPQAEADLEYPFHPSTPHRVSRGANPVSVRNPATTDLTPVAEEDITHRSPERVDMGPSRDQGDMNGHDNDRTTMDRHSDSTDDRTMIDERGSTEVAGEMDTETKELVAYLTDLDVRTGILCLGGGAWWSVL
ncbi:hypothetical protein BC937DRAFT_86641, partial [Endogone sp. FLAS-F59071]